MHRLTDDITSGSVLVGIPTQHVRRGHVDNKLTACSTCTMDCRLTDDIGSGSMLVVLPTQHVHSTYICT